MRYSSVVARIGLAVAIGAAAGAAVAQDSDSRGGRGWHGPWHMWDDDWGGPHMGPGMMGMMGPRMMMPRMFVMMDTDGDGAVSLDEMQAVHKRMFDLVDENEDGKLTPEEMRAFMRGSDDD
jgi:hypothetical protein